MEAAWHHRSAYRPAVALRRPGSGPGCGPRPGPCRQPAAACPLGRLEPAQETSGDRQRRCRARTCRLVLVAGGVARLNPPSPRTEPWRDRIIQVTARGAMRPEAMSNRWPPRPLATPVLRPALRSQPNTRSCGNQPAHISLDHASRNDTLTSTSIPPRFSPIPVPYSRNTITSSSPPSRPSPLRGGALRPQP